jgi:DNA-binding transcriptional LysR family regulator
VRAQALFRDRFVGVVRAGHALARGRMTAQRYAKAAHIVVSRRGDERTGIDDALDALGLQRRVVTIVDGFAGALALARDTELVASVPERHTGRLRAGMHTFELPVGLPAFTVSLLWHPRMHADAAHRWLRDCVREVCGARVPGATRRSAAP